MLAKKISVMYIINNWEWEGDYISVFKMNKLIDFKSTNSIIYSLSFIKNFFVNIIYFFLMVFCSLPNYLQKN
jgi:hypothetical protein